MTGIDPGARCRLAFPDLKYVRWYPEGQPDTAAETYTAADGDTLSGIATRHDLPRWKTLWDYWGNTDLRQNRCNADPVPAGRAVYVPRPDRELAAGKQLHALWLDQCHPKRTLTFRFVDATTGGAMPDLTVRILQEDTQQTREEVTDKDGKVVIDGTPGQIFTVMGIVKPGYLGVGDPAVFGAGFKRSLDDLLRDTLIGATVPDTWHELADALPAVVPPHGRPTRPDAGLNDQPLWGVTVPPGPLVKVKDLVCAVHGCHGGPVPVVCESIEWEPFIVTFDGVTRKLELDAKYRVRSQFLVGGEVGKDANRLWPLEAKVDFGLQNVFAYQLDPGANGPELNPVPKAVYSDPQFLPPLAAVPIADAIGQPAVDIPVVR